MTTLYKPLKIEDSNLAAHNSLNHRNLKIKAAKSEKAWKGCGEKEGIEVWRIENFKVKRWPTEKHGEFYSGDSYIILHTKILSNGTKSFDVFFWLGAQTSQDEACTAAYKTVELDDLLGDLPSQYREVQGNESKEFLELFDKMTILDGGIDSGFRHTKQENHQEPRLLYITGFNRHVQVYQVPLKSESLNNCDSFVLDAGSKIYQFNGETSTVWEKRKANAIVNELQQARFGKVKRTFIIDGLKDKGDPMISEFWTYFGGRPDSIPDEEDVKEPPQVVPSLHHVSDSSGVMEIKEVCRGKLDKKKLDHDDAFIIDIGISLFVWIGKGANTREKREAMKFAIQYLKNQKRDADIPIARISDGSEPKQFWRAMNGKMKEQGGRLTAKWD